MRKIETKKVLKRLLEKGSINHKEYKHMIVLTHFDVIAEIMKYDEEKGFIKTDEPMNKDEIRIYKMIKDEFIRMLILKK